MTHARTRGPARLRRAGSGRRGGWGPCRGPQYDRSGFTLIEVIVALAILSVAVVASIQGFAQGLRLLKLAGEHQHAAFLADTKLREVVTPKLGREQGQDEHGGHTFAWETTTTEIVAPDLAGDGSKAPTWRVFQIAVRVRWAERREVEVTTLRTAAATAEMGASTPTTASPRPAAPPPTR
jgi:general secretion pathway protein I